MSLLDAGERQRTLDAIQGYSAVRKRLQKPLGSKADPGINLRPSVVHISTEDEEKKAMAQALADFRKAERERIEQQKLERQAERLRYQLSALEARLASFRKRPSGKSILEAVAKYYRVPLDEILSARHSHYIIVPRHVAIYLCRSLTLMSFPSIGLLFNRDHSTVLQTDKKITRLVADDIALAGQINEIKASILAASILAAR